MTTIRRAATRRRWREAGPTGQVLLAWDQALATLARVGLSKSPSETAGEYARRAASLLPALGGHSAGVALPRLATVATSAAFDRRGATAEEAGRARQLAAQVTAGAWATRPWWRRFMVRLDPRPKVSSRPGADNGMRVPDGRVPRP